MKIISYSLLLIVLAVLTASCNLDWTEEQYTQYASLKASINNQGVCRIYVPYKEDGKVTFKLPVIISGSTVNPNDVDVHVAVDPDTLNTLNAERFANRTDLYYKLLDEKFYDFEEVVTVPAKQCVATLDLNFDFTSGLDMVEKWVLPLTVVQNPEYGYFRNPRKGFAKALLRVTPFNDFSGEYSTTKMEVYFRKENGKPDGGAMAANKRTAQVVDKNTVFFYAGLIDEELKHRAKYKIYVRFNEDEEPNPDDGSKSCTVWAEDPSINFVLKSNPTYTREVIPDAVRPYLEHRYVTINNLEYQFDDVTSAKIPVPYLVKGLLNLERNVNIQVPDEDQQIEWD